jgi:hypothetical protein
MVSAGTTGTQLACGCAGGGAAPWSELPVDAVLPVVMSLGAVDTLLESLDIRAHACCLSPTVLVF